MITKEALNALNTQDILNCNPHDLTDICSIGFDHTKSVAQRFSDFVQVVKNPYLFKVGNTVVKVSFSPSGKTFSDAIADMLKARPF